MNTFSVDEPVDVFLSAAEQMSDVNFFMTGDIRHARRTWRTARRANVKRLLLTHFFTPRYALQETHAAAAKEFANVALVEEGLAYEV